MMTSGRVVIAMCAAALLMPTMPASAQSWTGGYLAGTAGGGMPGRNNGETVLFDTNLDGIFTDTVRTAAGADAFTPGFCGGLAVSATAIDGCSRDQRGIDVGGRAGYDRQMGMIVVGGLVDVSHTDVTEHATAFSITPAFYSFSRKVDYTVGLRGRVGIAFDRLLIYGTAGPALGQIGRMFTSSNMANVFVPVTQEGMADGDGFARESVWGYQAGGGADVRLGSRWVLTAEYLLGYFDNREGSTIRSTRGSAPATNPFVLVNPDGTDLQRSDAFRLHTVKVGLGYRF